MFDDPRSGDGPDEGGRPDGDAHSRIADVSGKAVQARDVRGGVHFHGHGSKHSANPVPRQLPSDVRGFVNRTGELDVLTARLRDADQGGDRPPEATVHVIVGTGGVGKTALALRWAHRMCEHFPDGQLYVDLQGYGPGPPMTPEQVLERFLRAFGVSAGSIPPDLDSRAALYRSHLADRRVLLLLDNASTTAQVRPLLPGSSGCAVVVTSRDRLSGLVARDGARRLTVPALEAGQAVELLRYMTLQHRPEDDPAQVTELARLCGGLPLALRIAAERAGSRPHMPLTDLIQDLRDESALWDALATDDEEEASAVRSVFSWSYRVLPEEAAHLFRFLGLHPGRDFDVGAAAALAHVPERRTRRHLDILVGAHLLEQTGADRYRFHDLIRSYAIDQVRNEESSERQDQALRRLLERYLGQAHAAVEVVDSNLRRPDPAEVLTGPPPGPSFTDNSEALRWFELEKSNLLAVCETAATHRLDDFVWRLPYVLAHLPLYGEGWIKVLRRALAEVRRAPRPRVEGDLLESLGMALLQANRTDEGIEHHSHALELRRERGDGLGVVMSLNALGLAHLRGHRLGPAREHLERSLEAARSLKDRLWEGIALGNLVRCLLELGARREAMALGEQALAVHRETANRMSEFACLTSLSAALRETGEADRALALTRTALEIAQELDHTVREGFALLELGRIHALLEDEEEALVCFHEAAALHRSIGDQVREAESFEGAGEVYRNMGHPEEATRFLWQAANGYRVNQARWNLAVCLDRLAAVMAGNGAPESASGHWGEALEILEGFTDPRAERLRERVEARLDDAPSS